MRKITLIMAFHFLISCVVFAATGWFQDYVKLNVNGNGTAGPTGWYWIGDNPSYGTQLHGANLGTLSSLVIEGCDMKYWSDTQDRTGGAFYYKVTNTANTVTFINSTEVIWDQAHLGGNDYQGTKSTSIDIFNSLPYGTYQLHIWAKHWGTGQGDSWLSNSGNNYIATFTKAYPGGALSGTYKVGGNTSSDFSLLSLAVSALNTNGLSGNVVLEITSDITETNDISLGVNVGSNTITIKPGESVNPILTFSSTATTSIDGSFVIGSPNANSSNLISTDNIIIDGSNTINGSTKNMSIYGPVTSALKSVIRVFGNSNNITIKNCVIINRSTNGNSTAPIMVTNYNASSTNYVPDNIIVQNNTLTSVDGNGGLGITFSNSGTPTVGMTGIVVSDNTITHRGTRGIMCNYVNDATLSRNQISANVQLSSGAAAGIWLSTGTGAAGTFNIFNNRFSSLSITNTTTGVSNGYIAIDNQLAAPKIVNVYNNFITGFSLTAAVTNSKIYGYRHIGTSTSNVFNNTFVIPEMTNMTTFGSSFIAAIAFATAAATEVSPTGTMNIRNNLIISNETTMKSWGIRRVGTGGTFSSNNNVIYVANEGVSGFAGFFNNADQSSLANWKTASSNDAASVSKNAIFVSSTDLRLTSTSIQDADLAVPRQATVTTDILGKSRYSVTYAGAHQPDAAHFRSVASGDINDANKWQASLFGTAWANAFTAPTENGSTVTVENEHEISVNANTTATNFVVEPGGKLTIDNGFILNATNLTIKSDATNGTATLKNLGTLNVSGNSTVQQYLTNQSWYLSSPMAGTVTPTNLSRIQGYNEGVGSGNDWSVSGTTMQSGKGYITSVSAAPNTIEFTGTINSGDISIPLTRQAATDANKYGFNLIGNPYTAYLDWTAVAAANVSKMPTSTMWYRTKVSGSWAFSTVNGSGVTSPANVSAMIPPMQAFWVRASTVGNSNLELTSNMVNHDNNSSNKLKAPAISDRQLIRIQVSNNINTDELVIYTDALAANTFDVFDSPKMSNESADIPEISTIINGQSLVINGMNSLTLDTEIPILFMTKTANTFKLKANQISNLPEGTKVILSDFGNEFDLTSGDEYHFSSTITDNTNRFNLIFRAPGTTTNITKVNDNRILAYSNNKSITIKLNDNKLIGAEASVYNTLGQKLLSKNISSDTMQFDFTFKPDVYIIKVNNITTKVIVK